jgi:hypothetical protein
MYECGVEALLQGELFAAAALLQTAVSDDPASVMAWAALAVALAGCGSPRAAAVARRALRSCSLGDVCRRQRQHVEVLCLSVGSQRARATALAREHLLEFPDDRLVQHVLVGLSGS